MVRWAHRFNSKAKWPWILNSSPLCPKTTVYKNSFITYLYWIGSTDTYFSLTIAQMLVSSLIFYSYFLMDFIPHIPHHHFVTVAFHCFQLLSQFLTPSLISTFCSSSKQAILNFTNHSMQTAIILPQLLHLPTPLTKPVALGFSFPIEAKA